MNPPEDYSAASSTDLAARNPQGNGGPATATGPAAKAKRTASRALGTAREKVSSVAAGQKEAAAGRIGGYSDRLRATAESAGEEDPNIAHFASRAADRLQEVADYVRDADFGRLRRDAADVAHRHPALFMGGMLVAGLVLGNLAKASVQTLREDDEDFREGRDDHYSDEGGNGYIGHEAADASDDGTPGGVSDSFDPEIRPNERGYQAS